MDWEREGWPHKGRPMFSYQKSKMNNQKHVHPKCLLLVLAAHFHSYFSPYFQCFCLTDNLDGSTFCQNSFLISSGSCIHLLTQLIWGKLFCQPGINQGPEPERFLNSSVTAGMYVSEEWRVLLGRCGLNNMSTIVVGIKHLHLSCWHCLKEVWEVWPCQKNVTGIGLWDLKASITVSTSCSWLRIGALSFLLCCPTMSSGNIESTSGPTIELLESTFCYKEPWSWHSVTVTEQ